MLFFPANVQSHRNFALVHRGQPRKEVLVALTSDEPSYRVGCIMGIVFPSAAGGPMTAGSGYVLETLREGAEFTLYRGRQHGTPVPPLAVAPAAEQPSPQSLRRLEHEYLLAADLDPAWAARPLALTRHEGRAVLILKDPGGELLD